MELTILGSGTCVPSGRRCSAGYWVDAGPLRIRLDCGAGTVHAMARFGLPWETLTHQVVSHFHVDHVGELAALLFAFKYGRSAPRSEPLTIAGPCGLERLVAGIASQVRTELLEQAFPLVFVEVAPGDTLELDGGVSLAFAKTRHTEESLAVRIESEGRALGYTGDAAPSDGLADFFSGVDALVCECSFLDDAKGTKHMVAADAAALATSARARQLIATHFYFDPEASGLADRLRAGYAGIVTIAEDGLRVVV